MVSEPLEKFTCPPPNSIKVGDSFEALFRNHEASGNPYPISNKSLPSPLSIIHITREALEKCYLMAEQVKILCKAPVEAYALLLGHSKIIEDLIFPPQIVSSASVYISPEGILSLKDLIQNETRIILGWVHSHADFGVFFSGTDYENQKVLLAETANYLTIQETKIKYCYGMTVNLRRDLFGIVTTQYPTGDILNELATFEIHGNLSSNWDPQRERSKIYSHMEGKTEMHASGFFSFFKHRSQNNNKDLERKN